ncbi:MAG: alpha-ketoacid dehydrogenase subunit beta [Pseudomonadota bacterium]
MAIKNIREAINETLHQEMERDENIIILGEDISGGAGTPSGKQEAIGGIWGTTAGLLPKFGPERVIDTPISESAIVGAAAGASLNGKRAIAELMFADFIGVSFDQLYNQIAKFRYMFGGEVKCPVVVRMIYGAGMNSAAQHSQAMYSILTAIPGLKVVTPTNAADAKGLLTTAIRDDDPVMFFEHKALFTKKCEVPDDEHLVPFGQANLVRSGDDITVVAIGRMVSFAEKAADKLAEEGVGVDLIDPRTLSPLDEDTIIDSVEKTGRLVVIDESPPRCSIASDLAGIVAQKAFSSLKAPIEQVTAPHTPIPFARELERGYVPSPPLIEARIRQCLGYK